MTYYGCGIIIKVLGLNTSDKLLLSSPTTVENTSWYLSSRIYHDELFKNNWLKIKLQLDRVFLKKV